MSSINHRVTNIAHGAYKSPLPELLKSTIKFLKFTIKPVCSTRTVFYEALTNSGATRFGISTSMKISISALVRIVVSPKETVKVAI